MSIHTQAEIRSKESTKIDNFCHRCHISLKIGYRIFSHFLLKLPILCFPLYSIAKPTCQSLMNDQHISSTKFDEVANISAKKIAKRFKRGGVRETSVAWAVGLALGDSDMGVILDALSELEDSRFSIFKRIKTQIYSALKELNEANGSAASVDDATKSFHRGIADYLQAKYQIGTYDTENLNTRHSSELGQALENPNNLDQLARVVLKSYYNFDEVLTHIVPPEMRPHLPEDLIEILFSKNYIEHSQPHSPITSWLRMLNEKEIGWLIDEANPEQNISREYPIKLLRRDRITSISTRPNDLYLAPWYLSRAKNITRSTNLNSTDFSVEAFDFEAPVLNILDNNIVEDSAETQHYRIAICKVSKCVIDGVEFKKGEVITFFPLCGKFVFQLPKLKTVTKFKGNTANSHELPFAKRMSCVEF